MDALDRPALSIPAPRALRAIGWTLLAAMAAWALANLHWGRAVGWDEVEFLRATDWIRQGKVPYRDFFEHHTPLAWFLMAPFESLSHGPGVAPVLWMRWLQVPLWAISCWRLQVWMREEELPEWTRWLAIGALLGTPFFVFSALEFRVDTLGTFLVLLGLDALRRPGRIRDGWGGALLALAVLANLRLGPLCVVVAAGAGCLDPGSRSWRLQPRRGMALAMGALLALLPWALYLIATRSFADMWAWCVVANAKASQAISAPRALGTYLIYPWSNLDLPGILLEGGALAGALVALRTLRRPGTFHLLLLAQAVNLAFVAYMKVQYLYHLQLTLCLAAPFLALALGELGKAGLLARRPPLRWAPWAGAGALAFGLLMNASTLASLNDHATLRLQDRVLKQAAALAPPGSTVLDGCGWLLESKPAYRFWFLPALARIVAYQDPACRYTPEAMGQDPPVLVIANARLENLAGDNPPLGLFLTTQYLPVAPNLWVPGLSCVLTPRASAWTWPVLTGGDYRLVCSPALAGHPWFSAPFSFTRPILNPSRELLVDPRTFPSSGQADLSLLVDGKAVSPASGVLHLAPGQRLEARYRGTGPMGVMLVREGTGALFNPPPPNLTLDYITFTTYWPRP